MIDDLVSQIETRFGELEQQLSDPEVIGDRERFRAASKAYSELEPAAFEPRFAELQFSELRLNKGESSVKQPFAASATRPDPGKTSQTPRGPTLRVQGPD